jgi:gliding motility-associated-like protein
MKKLYSLLSMALLGHALSAQVDAGSDVLICTSQPVSLTAAVTGQLGTTAYTVSSFAYTPETYAGTAVPLSDDAVSGVLPIGFSFCFLGNTYTNFYIGSNGWVGFTAGQPTAYTSAIIPNTGGTVPKNCIMGPWQDWLPGSTIKYQTVGTAPNRKLVVSWDNSPMFSCTSNLGRFQIVLFETSNIIENHITNKPTCAWAGGTATMGIHNLAGNAAFVVPGRNSTNWTATNESWRYTPNGVQWTTLGGTPIGTGLTVTVTPTVTTTYVVSVPLCGASTVTDQVVVTVGAGLNYAGTQVTPSSCTNATGNIVLNVSSSSGGPFTYEWDDPSNSTSTSLFDLPPGDYTVTVTDESNGCVDTETFELPENNTLFLETSFNAPSCNGEADGSASVDASSNFPTYTYLWNDPAGQTTPTATGLAAGFYSVTVTDADGCESNALVIVNQPNALVVGTPSIDAVSCAGLNDGSIQIPVSGGTAGYTYAWSNGDEDNLAGNLSAGSYSVTVTDANDCQTEATFEVTEPSPLQTEAVIEDVTCSGFSDGSAEVIATGGTAPYTFNWTELGTTGAVQSGLVPGSYEIVVTDANGCTILQQLEIEASTQVLIDAEVNNVSCAGESDGEVSISVQGGTPNYNYAWNDANNQTSATATGLSSGTYEVVITDANNCTVVYEVVIDEPQPLTVNITNSSNVLCFGQSNGSALAVASGGTAPYSFDWSGGQTTAQVNTFGIGLQVVTVTDANGCEAGNSIQITQPADLDASNTFVNPSCFDGSNGSATVIPSGGVGGYSFDWAGSTSSAATANGLSAGTYTAVVTDANGCTHSEIIILSEPPAIVVQTDADGATCGLEDGALLATANGGTGNLTFQWDGFAPGASVNNVGAGSYSVTVTDANNCSVTAQANVTTVNSPNAQFDVNVLEGYMPLNVVFFNQSTGGTIYNWDFGDGNEFLSSNTNNVGNVYDTPGFFEVTLTVTNEGGCTDVATGIIEVYDLAILNAFNVFTPNGDGLNDRFVFEVNGIRSFECIVFDRWGKEITRWSDPNGGWDGKIEGGRDADEGTYFYVVKAQGFDDTNFNKEGDVTLMR